MKTALAALLPLLSCAHVAKVGDACQADEAYCAGPGAALACRLGRLQQFFCGGPQGCSVDKLRNVSCDQSANSTPATPCFTEYEGRAECGSVAGAFLQCLGGSWVQLACNPPGAACHEDAGGISCR